MNLLYRIKSHNRYDVKTDVLQPVDVDGTTALLELDGTSWEWIDGKWQQIELLLDEQIKQSIYPFISSICESINNKFVSWNSTQCFGEVIFGYKETNCGKKIVEISNLEKKPIVVKGDFIIIITCNNSYLTQVLNTTENTIEVSNDGVDIRITDSAEPIVIQLISFPQSFINTVLDMLGYDMFIRESKELRQERLGNYTYTNFDSNIYYGDNAYPKQFIQSIKYWERGFV